MALRHKLLATFLPITLIPLTLAGVVSSVIAYQRAYQQATIQLHDRATLAAELTYYELSGAIRLLKTVAADPLLLESVREGTQQIEAINLQTRAIEAVETEFIETKLFKPNLQLNNYLQSIAKIGNFAEVFVTERYGFNIAYSQPTSDFVQRDENWWQQGKQQGQWFDQPQFDQSTNQITVDLITSIYDGESGEFIGVVKGGYKATNLHRLTEQLGQLKLSRSERLQILKLDNNPTGIITIQADQSNPSKDHLEATQILRISTKFSQKINGSQSDQKSMLTVSWTDQNRLYAMTPIPETDWVVIATVNQKDIQLMGNQIATIFVLFFVCLGFISTLAILKFSRKLSAPIDHLAQVAKKVINQTDFSLKVPVKTNDYAGQLNQVFINILSNAIDAIDEYSLQRSPEEIKANPSWICIQTELLANNWIKIVISDNGPGIPEEIHHRLFDSFFTTKSVGKGTGLGLSISYQIIVEKHHGKMSCNSILGKGTEFVIEIPVLSEL